MNKPSYLVNLTALAVFLSGELVIFWSKGLYPAAIIVNAVLFYCVYKIVKKSGIETGSWYNFLILPFALLNSFFAYILIIDSQVFMHVLVIAAAGVIYYYLHSIFLFHFLPLQYKSFQIENISSYGGFLSVFFLASALYAIESFLKWPLWSIILILTFFFLIVIYQVNWAHKIPIYNSSAHIFIDTLILVELAWTLSFLPLRFDILGLQLAAAYYIVVGLTKHYLQGTLEAKIVKTYIGIGVFSVVVILLSARWI